MTALPLDGLTVLEFTHTIMGPSCGVVLADLGADVIRVEPAPQGDHTRRLTGFASGFYVYFNRNKRAVAIDLKSDAGRGVAADLLRQTDALVENFGPGTMERLGLGWEQAHAINPRLVYCALKGFLPGPYAHRPALDEIAQYMSGLSYMTGPPGQPLRAGASVVDIMGGVMGVVAILAALRQRDRDGQGRKVTASLFEAAAFLTGQHMAGEAATGEAPPPMPVRRSAWGVYETFATRDGERLFIGITSDPHWTRLLRRVRPARPAGRSALHDQHPAGREPRRSARDRRRAGGHMRPRRPCCDDGSRGHPVLPGEHPVRPVPRPAGGGARAAAADGQRGDGEFSLPAALLRR